MSKYKASREVIVLSVPANGNLPVCAQPKKLYPALQGSNYREIAFWSL